ATAARTPTASPARTARAASEASTASTSRTNHEPFRLSHAHPRPTRRPAPPPPGRESRPGPGRRHRHRFCHGRAHRRLLRAVARPRGPGRPDRLGAAAHSGRAAPRLGTAPAVQRGGCQVTAPAPAGPDSGSIYITTTEMYPGPRQVDDEVKGLRPDLATLMDDRPDHGDRTRAPDRRAGAASGSA